MSDANGPRKMDVDAVPRILYGNGEAASSLCYDPDGRTAVTTKGKEKGIHFAVPCVNILDDIFFSFNSFSKIHRHLALVSLR